MVTLRNKLAHGEYLLDLNHDRIILKVNGSDLVINIQKLARFVISSLSSSIKNYNQNELKRSFVCSNLNNGKDKEKYSVKDLCNIFNINTNSILNATNTDVTSGEYHIMNQDDEYLTSGNWSVI